MSLKEDFVQWKRHPVTSAILEELNQRQAILKDELAASAGLDPLNDRYRAGYIQAVVDFSDIDLEDKGDA